MAEFSPIGDFKIVSAKSLPIIVRQISQVASWYAQIFSDTNHDRERKEFVTNWRQRLTSIKRIADTVNTEPSNTTQEAYCNFTTAY